MVGLETKKKRYSVIKNNIHKIEFFSKMIEKFRSFRGKKIHLEMFRGVRKPKPVKQLELYQNGKVQS